MSGGMTLAVAALLVAMAVKRGGGGPGDGPAPLPGAAELAEYGEVPPEPIDGDPWRYAGYGGPHPSAGGLEGHLFWHPTGGRRVFDVPRRRWVVPAGGSVEIRDGLIVRINAQGEVGGVRGRALVESDGAGGTRLTTEERERRRQTRLELVWYRVPAAMQVDAREWWQSRQARPPESLYQRRSGAGVLYQLPVLVYYQPDGTAVRMLAQPFTGFAGFRRELVFSGDAVGWPGGHFCGMPWVDVFASGRTHATDSHGVLTRAMYLALEALGPPVPRGQWTEPPAVEGEPAHCYTVDADGWLLFGRSRRHLEGRTDSSGGAADCDAWTRSPDFSRRIVEHIAEGVGLPFLVTETRG